MLQGGEDPRFILRRLMRMLVREAAPHIFAHDGPPCVNGPCPEGKMSCGKAAEMRAKYAPKTEEA